MSICTSGALLLCGEGSTCGHAGAVAWRRSGARVRVQEEEAAKKEVEDQGEGIENGTGSERDLLAIETLHYSNVTIALVVLIVIVYDSPASNRARA